MIHLASRTGSAEACIDLAKWVHGPLRVRQMLRGYYQLFVELDLNQLKVKPKKKKKKNPFLPLAHNTCKNTVLLEKLFIYGMRIKTMNKPC